MNPRFLFAAFLSLALVAVPVVAQTPNADVYRHTTDTLIESAMKSSVAYDRLAYLSDRIGNRISGSAQLDQAIEWAKKEMTADGLENVHTETVMVPRWVRGKESAELVSPTKRSLIMLGLGGSIGTGKRGITAEVVTVSDFAELDKRGAGGEIKGKIVCYNVPFTQYGETVRYRTGGAVRAAKWGAVASLTRSVGTRSLQTPHTGGMRYDDKTPKIPSAAITAEDAEALARMQLRGEHPVVTLKMEAKTLSDVPSANVVAEWRGREKPNEIVVVGGHLDSWDVGTGSNDDGGGCMAVWEAVRLLKMLNVRPRRTVRVVLFTNEENGLRGGTGYAKAHAAEIPDHVFALESDSGVGKPLGFSLDAGTVSILQPLLADLLKETGATDIEIGGGGADISPLLSSGVPGGELTNDMTMYWQIHHTPADTMDKIDPKEFKRCVAALAVLTYIVAERPERLPRGRGQ